MVLKVKLLFFASAKDLFGKSNASWDLTDGSILKDVVSRLKDEHAMDIQALKFSVAVNKKYATSTDDILRDGDEIAILPPLGGG